MATEVNVPATIGPYRIQSKLGQGGMGAVYHAVHETLERPVALKILPAEFSADPQYVARFLREARVVATLRHENVVQVFDAGAEGGKYFIAMELVEGASLGKFLETQGSFEVPRGLELLKQAASGLAAAHAKGLVHRDIKPDNLLLSPDGRLLRIADFGLAMETSSSTQLTATGARLGTPQYMSPEQADGEQADARSDLYSLGVAFYRVFSGQPPFTSATAMNLLFKHKFEAPPDPRVYRPELPIGISHLLLTLMAKRREDRPQTAEAVVRLVEDLLQGKAIPPPPIFRSQLASGADAGTLVATPALGLQKRIFTLPRLAGVAGAVVALFLLAWLGLEGRWSAQEGQARAGMGEDPLKSNAGSSSGGLTPEEPRKSEPVEQPPFRGEKNPPLVEVLAKADELVLGGRSSEALASVLVALGKDPGHAALKDLRLGLERFQACESILNGVSGVLKRGQVSAAGVLEVDSSSANGKRIKENLESLERKGREQFERARSLFLGRQYAGLGDALEKARAFALEASRELEDARSKIDDKAKDEEFTGVRPFGFQLGVRGSKEKARKLRRSAEEFGNQAGEARTYGR